MLAKGCHAAANAVAAAVRLAYVLVGNSLQDNEGEVLTSNAADMQKAPRMLAAMPYMNSTPSCMSFAKPVARVSLSKVWQLLMILR